MHSKVLPGQKNVFPNNFPGKKWVKSFIKRNEELTVRIAKNIIKKRAEVGMDSVNEYFDHLAEEIEGIPQENILNYDETETNLTDDPGSKSIITKRGCK